ncbi:MAG: hypothetical protein FWG11_03215, partial [Promicromonosporaceae bacterium]|nr:hypothetical protein [Promicromonosporaceae bacterium]
MRSRMLARVGAAAAIAALLGGAVVTALPAEAAAPNPWATAKITLTEDGTGQGTSSATFVNTANGFFPGDDTATDGVVSSGDTVTYEVVVQFSASSARSVDLALTLPPYLEWPSSVSDQLCKNGYFITAERSGNTCRYTIPAGAVETLRAPLVLTAKDTAGMAINNQQVTAGIGVSGQGTYATASARAVTVVSAPAADVILTQPPAIALDYLNRITDSAALAAWSGPATGTFVATPVPLKYAGYATTKGASTAGAWFGYLDVSAFPAGTVWTVDGASTPVVNGMVAIPPTSGPATFTFTVPGGWPEQPEGTQVDYPARVIVDPSSFAAAGGLRNNGTGWQPGDGYDAGVSTLD